MKSQSPNPSGNDLILSNREFFAKKKGKKRIGFDEAKVIVNEYAKYHI